MGKSGNLGPWSYRDLATVVSADLGFSISPPTLQRYFTQNSVAHLNDTGDGRHKHFSTIAGSYFQLVRNIAVLHQQKAANQRAGGKLTNPSSGSIP